MQNFDGKSTRYKINKGKQEKNADFGEQPFEKLRMR
jgi:hypothetical protein